MVRKAFFGQKFRKTIFRAFLTQGNFLVENLDCDPKIRYGQLVYALPIFDTLCKI